MIPGAGELVFDPIDHIYYDDRGRLPSVTQVLQGLGITPDYGDPPQCGAPCSCPRCKGSLIHKLTAQLDAWNKTADPSEYCYRIQGKEVSEITEPYLGAYTNYLLDAKAPRWEHIELALAHPIFRYAGTLDRALPILDIKTGGKAEPLQLAAYWDLLTANGIKAPPVGYFLYLRSDQTYKLEEVKDLHKLARLFQHGLAIYNYKKGKV